MALTKEVVQDKVEVLEDGTLQVRTATRILEDGVVVAESYSRKVIEPDQDIADETGLAKEIAEKVFTPQRKTKFEAKKAPKGKK